ncbi:hypothetical protein [Phaeobacter sp. A36a-5a]|uniref:hypothetical protein n=1 Tax=Phaeobacter bryozoorum TaxID=1086632 RepID=UPI0035A6F697
MPPKKLAVFAVHTGFSLFGYGIARDLIRMANDTGSNVQVDVATAASNSGPVRSSCGAVVLADHGWPVISRADYVFVCSSRDPGSEGAQRPFWPVCGNATAMAAGSLALAPVSSPWARRDCWRAGGLWHIRRSFQHWKLRLPKPVSHSGPF